MSHWNIETSKSPLKTVPSFAKTLFVDEVVSGSPAESVGVRSGDKLLSVNKEAAFSADIAGILATSKKVTYSIFLAHENAIMNIQTEALPLGVVTSASSEAIISEYATQLGKDHLGFMTLWEREEHQSMAQAALVAKKLKNKKGVSLIGKVMRKESPHPIADLMLNISNAEVAGSANAYAGIRQFMQEYAHSYTMDIAALAKFYLLQDRQQRGEEENYDQALAEIVRDLDSSKRIQRYVRNKGMNLNEKQEELPSSLSMNMSLPVEYLEGGMGSTTLNAIIQSMPAGKLLPVCLLAAYRGNGPYNDALKTYIGMYPHVQDSLQPMLVLTDVKDKPKDRPYWFQAETLALKSKVPLTIVHEPSGQFVADLGLRGSPEFAVLDNQGTIVSRKSLGNDVDYWRLLSSR